MATVNLSDYQPLQLSDAGSLRIGIVVSEWNDFVTHNMRDGAITVLTNEGIRQENIDVFSVPGAFELSYATMQLCKKGAFDAVIAIGCVIRGETPHFDYVCSAVAHGITECNLQTDVPAIFCVLTDDTQEQSVARSGGELGNKGIEAAATALHMIGFRQKWL